MKNGKIYLTLVFTVLLGLLGSCKKETVDVTHLLTTVPSSASGVVVLNMEGLLEDAGCKIKDHVITPSAEVKEMLEKNVSSKEELKILFDGSTGIEPKGALVFYDSNRAYLTFALYDVNKFCSFVEEKNGGSFVEAGSGVKVNQNIAVKGAQAWICLTSGKRLDPDAIASYSSLKDSQSFLVTPMGEKLLVEEDDIRGWAMINIFVNEILSRSDRSMFNLGLGFLFEDAESVKFEVDFKKGELESEAIVLNDKYKPAKYQLPSDKIDVAALKKIGGTCDGLMAFTINSKLVKKFEQISQAFGGALFGDLSETLKNVDGTVGVAASTKVGEESFKGLLTTKGDVSPSLRDLISGMLGPVSQDGKYLMFSKGDVSGNLDVAECAEELKGSCLGMVVDATGLASTGYGSQAPSGFQSLVFKLKPESGGLEMDLEIKTTDPKENALLTIMKSSLK